MPISDQQNYPTKHFTRVYNHIIKPACELADFEPIRADDVLNTNHIALDVIKKVIESDMAICDLSSQNPNVLYELGIRQAFNKPVVLIKDFRTKRIFDIQGLRDLEYDENLRIDNVQDSIDNLAEIIKTTFRDKDSQINSLIKLLSINPAEISDTTNISIETELILENLNNINQRLNLIENNTNEQPKFYRKPTKAEQPLFDELDFGDEKLTIAEIGKLKKGDKVAHIRFGIGIVNKIIGSPDDINTFTIDLNFENGGHKTLLVRFASLYKVL